MSLDEWLRVGNQDIQEKSTGTKEKFWGLRGGMCPLSTPWLRPCLHSFLTIFPQQADVASNILLFFYKKKRKENKKIIKYY
jgi:hypothetical protein